MTKVIVQGFPGCFHDSAAQHYFEDDKIEIIPATSFQEQALQLEQNEHLNFAIMAIENSIAGSIIQNYRLIREYEFRIIGEIQIRIKHQLMALPHQSMNDIAEIHSHPMALYQCTGFLKQYPHIRLVETEDTALSAKNILENKAKGVAAIASKLAANIYNLDILHPNIENSKVNFTRFFILQRKNTPFTIKGDENKATIYVVVGHEVGSLLKVLECISQNNINLSQVQSYPVLGKRNTYYFHIDLEFDKIEQYQKLLKELEPITEVLKELGVYKKSNR